MSPIVPVIDLSRARASREERLTLAREIDAANSTVGFLTVVNHGVSRELLDDLYRVTAEFFDTAEKVKLTALGDSRTSRGYIPPKRRALARTRGEMTPADLVELFSIGQTEVPAEDAWYQQAQDLGYFAPNVWPEGFPEFRTVWERYFTEVSALAVEMMRLFALALDLDENFFDDKVDRPISNLFANHYPPLDEEPEPGQIRVGTHTDYGTLTLLYQPDEVGGLEVFVDEEWFSVPPIKGSYVVNIGDLMARWTNDRWTSTLHRVQNPDFTGPASRRISFPFFCQPNYDAEIRSLPSCVAEGTPSRYATITAGTNVSGKTHASFDL